MTGNPPSTTPSRENPEILGPLRILLAAESVVEQKLASGLLAKHGHRVYVANNGQEVIRGCAENEIDVVILDQWLCEADGPDVIREIRNREKSIARRIPILAMSDNLAEDSRPDGTDGFIEKPLRIEQMIACLASAMSDGQASENQGTKAQAGNSVDWTIALDAVGGRRDLLDELVQIFFAEYPVTLEAIRGAIANQDPRGLQLYAHKLKGCLRYFGKSDASELAAEFEDMGRRSDVASAKRRFDELVVATELLIPNLKAGPHF
jgi:CheY-like chemotaxis protein/HPt (histidine-containing phosphotransfer) domain-containing protein